MSDRYSMSSFAAGRHQEAIIAKSTPMASEQKSLDELFDLSVDTIVYWDLETCSKCKLKDCGSFIYAADASTDMLCMCYAIGNGPVETWQPGMPVPAPFADPTGYTFVSDNWFFERPVHACVLVPRYKFAPIPLENMDCAQRKALASAFPAELGLRCKALDLPYRKDDAARRAMLRLSNKMHVYKRPEDRERDLELTIKRCVYDVGITRACYTHPRIRPLLIKERDQLLFDMMINERGVCANVPFLEASQKFAIEVRKSINARLSELTAGSISSVDQVGLIKDAINACGHDMASLGKRSVSAVLGRNPDDLSRELLELRQRGAPASPRKSKRLLLYADPVDHRIRGALRIYGGAPGRWSSIGAQLHNLARNDAKYPACLIDALLTGKHDEITRFGDPLKVIGQLGRAALCAAPGYELICADFGAIESRVVAWIAGEAWKLENFKRYDETGDKNLDNYRSVAHRMLKKTTSIAGITDAERQLGKCAELACGFSGWTGAWRKIAHDTDVRSDDEVMAIIRSWRHAHPKICEFWDRLMQAARLSIHAKKAFRVMPAPHPEIITDFDGTDLTITLPSNRVINYPNARLTKNDKFEEGPPNIEFFDNARGKWKPARGWRGTFTENVVQGIARDLLAAAIIRAETRGMKVVFHCHDELVIEAPIGTIPEQDLLALLIEPPEWAVGLPLGGKVRSGPIYLEAPATAEPSAAQPSIEHASDTDDRENEDHVSEDADVDVSDESIPCDDIGPTVLDEMRAEASNPTPWEGDRVFAANSGNETAHICIQCHLTPPDGTEHAIGGNGLWIHARCENEYIRTRLAEEGIASKTLSEQPSSEQPSSKQPSSERDGGNGFDDDETEFDDFDFDKADDNYPHSEHEIGRIEDTYIYRTMKGALHMRVVKRVTRRGKKSYPQYHLEDGKWVKGKPEGPALPYRLPELLAAPANATVEICEGEKDAKTLAFLGLISTTNPGGAGKWTSDLNKWLSSFTRANIYEDNDEAGHRHAAQVARQLCGIIPDIRVISFREMPEHSDVSDWLKDKTREDLIARLEQAPKFIALESVCAADEEIEAVDWVWPDRFALKKIGIIAGMPDEGKGVLLSDIIARATTGAEWPCNEGTSPIGNVILLTAEDDINDTIVPRLMAAGADLKRVHIIKMLREADKERMFSLITDLPVLRQKAAEIGDIIAIIIDPIAAYLGIGNIDSFRATDVRAILTPLKMFAEEITALILGVMHFNKKTDVTNVMLRVSDSLAYTAASRHVYAVINDPDNDRKLFVKGKNNIARKDQPTLAFGIAVREVGTDRRTGKLISAPYIIWHTEPVDITATEALSAAAENKSPSAIDKAKNFIEMLLSAGPIVSNDVRDAAKENGISKKTLDRAREALGARVDVRKDGPLNNKGETTWRWHWISEQEDEDNTD